MKLAIFSVCILAASVSAFPANSLSSLQLEDLVDQVIPEITTYFTRSQVKTLFYELALVVRDYKSLENIFKGMSRPILNTLTAEQKTEFWASIEKAAKGFGGFPQLKVIVFHSMDALQNFMGDAMDKDRAEVQAKVVGKSDDEKLAIVYEVFQQYFNIDFGQKVMDTVKYSMTEDDWNTATEDAAVYLNVEHFNLNY